MSTTETRFTRECGMKIQKQHMEGWRCILAPSVFHWLEKQVAERNAKLDPRRDNGYDVCRGVDIDSLVINYNRTRPNIGTVIKCKDNSFIIKTECDDGENMEIQRYTSEKQVQDTIGFLVLNFGYLFHVVTEGEL